MLTTIIIRLELSSMYQTFAASIMTRKARASNRKDVLWPNTAPQLVALRDSPSAECARIPQELLYGEAKWHDGRVPCLFVLTCITRGRSVHTEIWAQNMATI